MSAISALHKGRRQLLGRLNETFALLNLICNANSCDLIELDGELDLERLQNAAEQVIDRHPMARSVSVRRGLYFYWVHCEHRLPIQIETRSINSDDPTVIRHALLAATWERRVVAHNAHPFRFIYTRTPRGAYLQIITSHVYTDGKAANIFTGDVAQCYAALGRGQTWNPPAADIPDRSHDRMFLRGLSWWRRAGLFLQGAKGLLTDVCMPVGRLAISTPRTTDTDVLMIDLPDALTQGLRAQAARRKLTVHPFLLIAVLRTCEAFNRARGKPARWPLRIVDNFSLRRFSNDPAIEHIYDCVAVPYKLALDARRSDDALLQDMFEALEKLKQGDALAELYRLRFYHWLSLPMPKTWAVRMACFMATRADVICTNVGVLDPRLEHIGDVRVKRYFSFPQLLPPGKVMYQISSFRGTMRLALLYDRGQLSETEARRDFADAFIKALGQLVGLGQPQAEKPTEATEPDTSYA